jgi:exosortase/archaeosortase family protein
MSTTYSRPAIAQRDLLVRFFVMYAVLMGSQYFIASQALAPVFGHPSFTLDEWPLFSKALPALLLLLLFIVVRRDAAQFVETEPPRDQVHLSLVAFILITALLSYLLHPSDAVVLTLMRFASHDLTVRMMAIGATILLLYTVLLVPAAYCLFPAEVLSRHWRIFLATWSLYALYAFGEVLNVFYFRVTGPWLVRVAQFVIRVFLGETAVGHHRWELTYHGFTVVVGPACSDFAALLLLAGILAFVWWKYPPRKIGQIATAILVTVCACAGVFVLNVTRIVSIMIVGSHWRSFAIGLFHSSSGAFLLFLYSLCWAWMLLRMTRRWQLLNEATVGV